MTDPQKNLVKTSNLSIRESVLTSMGARCGRCGFKDHLAPLVVRAEGLTQNRKATNYSQYWLSVLGLSVSNPSALEIICRNCLAIEQEAQRTDTKPTAKNIYIYITDLPWEQAIKRQRFLDVLEEPKTVYIITGSSAAHPRAVYNYKGNTHKGSPWEVNLMGTEVSQILEELGLKYSAIEQILKVNGLFKVVDGVVEMVS